MYTLFELELESLKTNLQLNPINLRDLEDLSVYLDYDFLERVFSFCRHKKIINENQKDIFYNSIVEFADQHGCFTRINEANLSKLKDAFGIPEPVYYSNYDIIIRKIKPVPKEYLYSVAEIIEDESLSRLFDICIDLGIITSEDAESIFMEVTRWESPDSTYWEVDRESITRFYDALGITEDLFCKFHDYKSFMENRIDENLEREDYSFAEYLSDFEED